MDYKGKKFVASYSGGKDSTLAIYRAIKMGMLPVELITTYNIDRNRSWFHGIPDELLERISIELDIPINLMVTAGKDYEKNFVSKLKEAKEKGAEVCVFGDIDLEGHFDWCTKVCEKAGIEAYFPLWGKERKDVVYEFIDEGFKTIITIVDTSRMPDHFVGKILTRDIADEIAASGADICGENGEYHTFAFDGPIFSQAVKFSKRDKIKIDNFTILPIGI